jgi:hypothetical protein
MLGVSAITIASDVFRYFAYASLTAGAGSSPRVQVAETIASTVSIAYLLVLAVLAVLFLVWVYRTNAYLRLTSGYPIRATPGWAVAWYFVPIANLFRPLRDMRDIWRASHGGASGGLGLVNAWWAAFLVSNVVWLAAPAPELTSASAYMLDSLSYLAADAVSVIPCALTLVLVTRTARACEPD